MIEPQPLSKVALTGAGDDQLTFKLRAERWMGGEVGLHATVPVETKEKAQAIAARFPKSVKVKGTTLGGHLDENCESTPGAPYRTVGYVTFQVIFERNGVTGEFNETGLKRYRSFRRNAEKLGFATTWAEPLPNQLGVFATEDEFENCLSQEA